MRSCNTILVAVDFSDCTQELIDQATSLADPDARIVLLHVVRLPDGLASTATLGLDGDRSDTAEVWLVRKSSERLAAYLDAVASRGFQVRSEVVLGGAAETIVARARHHGAELIVMGTHGRRGLTRAVGGSVAAGVIARATTPVLTVRTQHKPTCRARSCDVCVTHLTPELSQLRVERDG